VALDPLSELLCVYAEGTRTCQEIAAEIAKTREGIPDSRIAEVVTGLVDGHFPNAQWEG
jgi:hypothetical protein